MKKVLKYSALLLLAVLLASCYPAGYCIDADDFGFPKLTVSATGKNVTPTTCQNCIEYSQWTDSKEVLNGDTIYFVIGPPLSGNGTTSNTWTSWLGGSNASTGSSQDPGSTSDPANACTFSNPKEPWITTTPDRVQSNTADVLNAPCWFQNGMFLYMLSADPKSQYYDPNTSQSALRDPEDNGFQTQHLGPYQYEQDTTQCNSTIQSVPYSHSLQQHPNGSPSTPFASITAVAPNDVTAGVFNSATSTGGEYNYCGGWFGNTPFTGNYANGELYFKINDDYYDDNGGSYTVVMKKGVSDVVGGPIATALNLVRTEFVGSSTTNPNGAESATQIVYNNVLGENAYIKAVRATLMLYIMFMCIFFMFGMTQVTQGELVVRLFKVALILALISQSSWNIFYSHFFNVFNEGLTQIINIVTNSGATVGNSSGNNYESGIVFFDTILHSMFSFETTTKIFAIMIGQTNDAGDFIIGFVYGLLIYIFLFFFLIMLARAALMYMLCLLALGVLIALSPLFIVFFLFEWTKPFFMSWSNQLISYLFQPILIFTALSLISNLILQQLYRTVGYRVCVSYLDYYLPWWTVSIRPDQFHMISVPPSYLTTDLRFVDAPFLDPDYADNQNGATPPAPSTLPAGWLQPFDPPYGWSSTAQNPTIDIKTGAYEYADDPKLSDAINNKKYVGLQDVLVMGVYIYVLDRFWELVVPLSRGLATVGGSNAVVQNAANDLVKNTVGRAYDISKGHDGAWMKGIPEKNGKPKQAAGREMMMDALTLKTFRSRITNPILNPIQRTLSGGYHAVTGNIILGTALKAGHGLFDPFAGLNYAGSALNKGITGGYSAERNKKLNLKPQQAVDEMKATLAGHNQAVGKKKESYRDAIDRINNAKGDLASANNNLKSMQRRYGVAASGIGSINGAVNPLAHLQESEQRKVKAAEKAVAKAKSNLNSLTTTAQGIKREIDGMEEAAGKMHENLHNLEHAAAEAKSNPLREKTYDKVFDEFFKKNVSSKINSYRKKIDKFIEFDGKTHDFIGNIDRLNKEKLNMQVDLHNARQQRQTGQRLETAKKALDQANASGDPAAIRTAHHEHEQALNAHDAHQKTIHDLEHGLSQNEKAIKSLNEANHVGQHFDRKLVNTFRQLRAGASGRQDLTAYGNEMSDFEKANDKFSKAAKEVDRLEKNAKADPLNDKKVTKSDHDQKLQEIDKLQHEQEGHEANIKKLTKEKNELESQISGLGGAEKHGAKLTAARKELSYAKNELPFTQSDKKARAALEAKINQLQGNVTGLEKDAAKIQAHADTQKQLEEATHHSEATKKALTKAKSDAERIDHKLKSQEIGEKAVASVLEATNKQLAALKSKTGLTKEDAESIVRLEQQAQSLQTTMDKTNKLNAEHQERAAALKATKDQLDAAKAKTPQTKEEAESIARLEKQAKEQQEHLDNTLAKQHEHDAERTETLKAFKDKDAKAIITAAEAQQKALRPKISPHEAELEKAKKEMVAAKKDKDAKEAKIKALQKERRQEELREREKSIKAAEELKAKDPDVIKAKKLEDAKKNLDEIQKKLDEETNQQRINQLKAEREAARSNLAKLQKASHEEELAKLKMLTKGSEADKKKTEEQNKKLSKEQQAAIDRQRKEKEVLGHKLDAERKKLHAATKVEEEKLKAKEDLIKASAGKVLNEAETKKVTNAIKEHLDAMTKKDELELNVAKAAKAEEAKGQEIRAMLAKEEARLTESNYNQHTKDAEHQRNVISTIEAEKNAAIDANKLKDKPDEVLLEKIARLTAEQTKEETELARINALRDKTKADRIMEAHATFTEHRRQMENAARAHRLLDDARRQKQPASVIQALEQNFALANAEIQNTHMSMDHMPLTDHTKAQLGAYLNEVVALSHAYHDHYEMLAKDKNLVTPEMTQRLQEQEASVLKQANALTSGGLEKQMDEIRNAPEFRNNSAFHDEAIKTAEEARDAAQKELKEVTEQGASRANKKAREDKEEALNKANELLEEAKNRKAQLIEDGTIPRNDEELAKIKKEMAQSATLPKEMINTANSLFDEVGDYPKSSGGADNNIKPAISAQAAAAAPSSSGHKANDDDSLEPTPDASSKEPEAKARKDRDAKEAAEKQEESKKEAERAEKEKSDKEHADKEKEKSEKEQAEKEKEAREKAEKEKEEAAKKAAAEKEEADKKAADAKKSPDGGSNT